ncbi:hypothetical protein ES708_31224 [subsurface metagenome]
MVRQFYYILIEAEIVEGQPVPFQGLKEYSNLLVPLAVRIVKFCNKIQIFPNTIIMKTDGGMEEGDVFTAGCVTLGLIELGRLGLIGAQSLGNAV